MGLGIVPIPVLAAIAIHSFSDFNLHIPANFLVLVAIMAIGYAALHLERHHRRERMVLSILQPAAEVQGRGRVGADCGIDWVDRVLECPAFYGGGLLQYGPQFHV